MKFLEELFTLLIENKEFPYYQAERRIDIFINFFIEDIIRQHTKFKDAIYVAAEFPLKKSIESDHSAHLDYLMYSKSKKRVLFVELKTDSKSYYEEQINFYGNEQEFLNWYNKMISIKMKGFKLKKQQLINVIETKIGKIAVDLKVETIILQPSVISTSDKKNKHYVQLKDLDIKTEYQYEWQLFKEKVLSQLK